MSIQKHCSTKLKHELHTWTSDLLTPDKYLCDGSPVVPAVRPPMREQITSAVRPIIRRWYDTGGNLEERIADAVLALFPQPTPTAVLTGGIGYPVQEAARREDEHARRAATAKPVSVADMAQETPPSREQYRSIVQVAEGSTFRARQHGDPQERFWFLAAGMGVVSLDAIMAHATSIDPSTIRDVTPPPATPEEGDHG